ncbi:hypothetical protein [Pseudonocardia alni]|uniref:hypothetical protein n=1 Tax=Pseudonocardia alni TaxID=33907 RepID=UPI0027A4E968|nr:hypothetical protein PaSha_14070 [Pseudonocardia alni]WFG47484.1 hypothetical protein PaSha_28800 [Pseudonocardia alni]
MTGPVHPLDRVLDRLLVVGREAYAERDTVRVDEGVPVADVELPDSFAVASLIDEVAPVTGGGPRRTARTTHRAFDIGCAVQCATGDPDVTALRKHAFDVYGDLLAVLRRDRRLGIPELVLNSWVAQEGYRPVVAEPDEDQDEYGQSFAALVLLEFVIHVEIYEVEER